ncbi:MAG: hypothetical protein LBP88_08570 [Treponema sp.]|nr:hypothetical protein [Treponema sp.]
MKNKILVKTAAFLLVFAGLTAAASGQITISGGLALSSATLQGAGGSVQSKRMQSVLAAMCIWTTFCR